MALACSCEFHSLLGVYFVQLPNYFSDSKNNDSSGVNLERYGVEPDWLSRHFSEVCQLKEFSRDPKALINAYILISALYE